jgi:hypothetical protein
VFAERFGSRWPASHHLGDADPTDVIVEPFAGHVAGRPPASAATPH